MGHDVPIRHDVSQPIEDNAGPSSMLRPRLGGPPELKETPKLRWQVSRIRSALDRVVILRLGVRNLDIDANDAGSERPRHVRERA
jgi:hypothetical protein